MIPAPNSVREKFESVDAAFAERPVRERWMIAAMVVGVVLFLIDFVAIQPIASDRHRIEIGASRTRDAQAAKEKELAALAAPVLSEEEQRIFTETQLVLKQIDEIENQMDSEIEGLVSPQAIVSVLEELLEDSPGLRLIRLESAPPHQIGADLESGVAAESQSTVGLRDSEPELADVGKLFRHGVQLEIEGDFPSVLDYLKRVERSDFHLIWDSLDYRVETYPKAIITIVFHTISDSEDWIGV